MDKFISIINHISSSFEVLVFTEKYTSPNLIILDKYIFQEILMLNTTTKHFHSWLIFQKTRNSGKRK